jgi:hypothetical protein
MLERRTFIVRIHAHAELPIVEDVHTGERVRLPDLTSIAGEIKRRLDQPMSHTPSVAAPERDERP